MYFTTLSLPYVLSISGGADLVFGDAAGLARLTSALPSPAALDRHPREGGVSDFWHRNTALEPASPARPAPSGSSLLSTERRPPRIPAPGDFPEALDQLHHGHPRGLSVRLAGFGGAQYGELVEAMIQFA